MSTSSPLAKGARTKGARTKGARTRERILSLAAPIFNRRGYGSASLSDIMSATGLEKGGIYRHFASKEELALAAFDHAAALHAARVRERIAIDGGAVARVAAFAGALVSLIDDEVVAGGCPLMNTAVETDDGDSAFSAALRARAQRGMRWLVATLRKILEDGLANGELHDTTNPAHEAAMMVAMLEGALMMSKLDGDTRLLRAAATEVSARAARLAVVAP